MSQFRLRRASRWLGTFSAVLGLVAAIAAPVAAGGDLPGRFGGDAWGTRANAVSGNIAVKLGRSAYQPCPCLGTNGEVRTNTIDTVRAGDAFRAAGIETTAMADKLSGMRIVARTTATVTDVRALDGLLTADAIEAVSTTRATSSGFTVSPAGSRFVDLRIGGQAVIQTGPGQRINLPGFGHVTLRNIVRYGDGVSQRGIQVEMLRIVITRANDLDIPVGTRIVVSHANSSYSRAPASSFVGGSVWAADATSSLASVENRIGRAAAMYIGCLSRGQRIATNNVEVISVPGILLTGTGKTRLIGRVDSDGGFARGTSRLEDLDLLDGIVQADVIKAVATSTWSPTTGGEASSDGSRFVNLRVLGMPFGDDVAPNTMVDVDGVGTLTLYATDLVDNAGGARAIVTMVVLNVTTANSFGLPVGTELRIARARTFAQQGG